MKTHIANIEFSSALASLERFVVENDDLLELESIVGRFNIFDALRVTHVEIRHSNFLAWLLDPSESHGQGALFLRAILMDLMKSTRDNGFACPISPIELEGEDLRGVKIQREWQHIDLLISCDQPPFVIAIENKIKSSEHGNQLDRYRKIIQAEYPRQPLMYVYLTVEGTDPSDEDGDGWVPYSYGDIFRVLSRVIIMHNNSIGDDVRAFLDHYLRLLKGQLMEDPKIEELCQRIYKNHRQALELIYKHAGSPAAGMLGEIEEAIKNHTDKWYIVNKTSHAVFFVPMDWLQWMPKIGARPKFDQRCWIVLRFELRPKKGFFGASVWPTTDAKTRSQVIKRLTNEPKEFGFRLFLDTASGQFTQLGRQSIGTWDEDEGPDQVDVMKSVNKILDELAQRLAKVHEALRPLIG